ncbi:hypothetical protein [Shimazuella alba]|uniref:Uncharacterized protein n=1 Tax=Shimazuella alba TaxID=2690964 RepID=A0A6I4VSU6_9BACL|nr:hypothetical protein [Shimazuella alba]MXQ54809.1 hypothetical protein [Shimazuella alba]
MLYKEWKRLKEELETAQRAVVEHQGVRDSLELDYYDPKKQKERETAQR